jgi:tyrosyl-DNA phosphodiesterase 2
LTLTTFNVWLDEHAADVRYRRIAELLETESPDIMVFQEVTPRACRILLAQSWIRTQYQWASAVGGSVGDYGMLLASRLPIDAATYTPLPSRARRGVLTAQLTINGSPLTVGSVHLDSGKRSAPLRRRQLGRLFGGLRDTADAVLLGDFNMRDGENALITAPFVDVWPVLRPGEPGYTEDTSINLMRLDARNKHRQVRFDRVLVKGNRWAPTAIDLLGTEPVSADQPRVFPSDHFGVRCRLAAR